MVRNNSSRIGVDESPKSTEEIATPPSLSFVVPTEMVDLPTRGRFYPKEHPLNDQECVEIRHMTTRDQDILNSKSLIKKGVALEKTIQGLIVDKNIRLDDMFIGDKNAIILQARISGISEIYDTNITCPVCLSTNDYSFNLSEIDTFFGDENESITEDGTFVVELPVSKVKVEVRLLTGSDEKQLQQLEIKKKKHKLPESPLSDQFKQLIASVNDEADKGVIGKFVDVMLSKDARFLQEKYNKVVPNIDLRQPFECKSCGFEDKLAIPLTTDFFWPNR